MQFHHRTGLVAVLVSGLVVLSACSHKQRHMEMQTREQAQSEAIARAQSSADAAMEAAQAAQAAAEASMAAGERANQSAERAAAMAEQNQAALRVLNDKIDRMFATMSRK